MWTGGVPVLGYRVADGKLVIDEDEAAVVRELFAMYLKKQAISAVALEANRRGWVTKAHVTKTGKRTGGVPFSKSGLGPHASQPDLRRAASGSRARSTTASTRRSSTPVTFRRVQDLLAKNAQSRGLEDAGPLRLPAARARPLRGLRLDLRAVRVAQGLQGLPLLRLHERPEARLRDLPLPHDLRAEARGRRSSSRSA